MHTKNGENERKNKQNETNQRMDGIAVERGIFQTD